MADKIKNKKIKGSVLYSWEYQLNRLYILSFVNLRLARNSYPWGKEVLTDLCMAFTSLLLIFFKSRVNMNEGL